MEGNAAVLDPEICKPCRGGVPPLTREEALRLLPEAPGWRVTADCTKIEKTFTFADFRSAFEFVKKVAGLADAVWHHPVINFGWGFCTVVLHTKKINGLHAYDFFMAGKINALGDEGHS
ncbi:MAG: 4a-hydroxytetrahydrobiopterin dehydratase [Burkholderiales bacterium]|nr:4a-hydroxytetrahydrobiopterin dehydratase [Pseudomonadota bacterium]